ncbi:MAG: GNAT family N-acetyltransferase [Gammaproteobacteria bacterium]|jgi:tRNA(Met) cytidine acetyltransferase
MIDSPRATAAELRALARQSNHRYLLVLAGSSEWARRSAGEIVAEGDDDSGLWVGEGAPAGMEHVPAARATAVLGQERSIAVFDAFSGFNPDAFGAVSGLIRGGGLLLLLVPSLSEWPDYDDPDYARLTVSGRRRDEVAGRFVGRMARILAADPRAVVCSEAGGTGPLPDPDVAGPGGLPSRGEAHADQRAAVEAVVRAGRGRARRPVVLTSDRGRGKSAALGMAAAELLRQGVERVIVTAPRIQAAARVFEHAARLLPGARAGRGAVHWQHGEIVFRPPDHLVHGPDEPARLLLVDEAAAVPAPLLEALLARYPRIAFATTIHGYEGTGRGFAVRFQKVLNARTPEWRSIRLEVPVRWAPGDPLECLAARLLLLDAGAAADDAVGDAAPPLPVERLDRDVLARDGGLLGELFGLLVLAHYRTRPFDLRLMLDAPNVSVYAMRSNGHVVATALVAEEGGFDAATAKGIWAGRMRPQGHLLPETLAAHLGLEEAPGRRFARVVRIAVHPAAQGRGIGSALLEGIARDLAGRVDCLGSSFGATAGLLAFWQRNAFAPVRLSVTRGATSGEHSVLVLRPLNEAGRVLTARARERFVRLFPGQLVDPLNDLEPAMATRLLAGGEVSRETMDWQDWLDLAAFGFGHRLYEMCIVPLRALALAALCRGGSGLDRSGRDVLVVKVLQAREWSAAARTLGLSGRADVVAALRRTVRHLLERLAPPELRTAMAQLREGSRR